MIDKVDECVWTFEYTTEMTMGAKFPCRSTILQLQSGELLIISPGPFTHEDLLTIKAFGPVKAIIAPNLYHHVYLENSLMKFPNVPVYGPRALASKIKKLQGKIKSMQELIDQVKEEVMIDYMPGNDGLGEFIFEHKATKTVIMTDLFFNIHGKKGFMTNLVFSIFGINNKLVQSRLIRWTTNKKKAFWDVIFSYLNRAPNRVIIAHGDYFKNPADVQRLRQFCDQIGKK